MLHRQVFVVFIAVILSCFSSALRAETVAVACTILPGQESASISLTNPFGYTASCQANCKFATPVYDDNPQIICAKSVPAGKQVEMCILKAAGNKLTKLVSGTADCRKP